MNFASANASDGASAEKTKVSEQSARDKNFMQVSFLLSY
jgi:hypothetical protein